MFRTRDFLLFSIFLSFLVIAIIVTVDGEQKPVWWNNNALVSDVEYKAVVPETKTDDRAEKLALMRDKVAESKHNGNLASVINSLSEEENDEVATEAEGEDLSLAKISLCSTFTNYSVPWSPANLEFEVVEGARIVYRNLFIGDSVDPSAVFTDREIVMQLPLRFTTSGAKNCLNSQVVGIALDGSLINNSDYTAYKVFSSETLIGYALDGFPIHGLNTTAETDQCGGTDIDGQYKYYLSSEREGMLGCFSGEPISF